MRLSKGVGGRARIGLATCRMVCNQVVFAPWGLTGWVVMAEESNSVWPIEVVSIERMLDSSLTAAHDGCNEPIGQR